jgi:hypothetical protein
MSGNCGCQRKQNINPNPNRDINLNPSPNQFKYNLLQQIQKEYSGFRTVETYSDVDIKELNDGRHKYEYLSSLQYGVNLEIIGITDDTKQFVVDPSLYTYDKQLGNIQIFSNELAYPIFTVLGFKGLKERKFLFKNIVTNITGKPLPNTFLFKNYLDFDVK